MLAAASALPADVVLERRLDMIQVRPSPVPR
jgi:hypothetical protein